MGDITGQDKRTCVIPDTNAWRSHTLLRTSPGLALLYTLRRLNGSIGLPEVIELELVTNCVEAGERATERARQSLDELGKLTGRKLEMHLPTQNDIEKGIAERLRQLEPLLVRTPFTLVHAKKGLARVHAKSPPNGVENQQFKDSAIWEAVLDLAVDYRVLLVTGDKAFFQDRNTSLGLARNLAQECRDLGIEVDLYPTLQDCVAALPQDTPYVVDNMVGERIHTLLLQQLDESAAGKGFGVGRRVQEVFHYLQTEHFDQVVVGFETRYTLVDLHLAEEQSQRHGYVATKGTCLFDLSTQIATDLNLDEFDFNWVDVSGDQRHRRDVFVRASTVRFITA